MTNSNVPIGNQFFRVVARAPTYQDRISVPLGAIIGSSIPVVLKPYHSGGYALESVPETQNPVVAFFQNIGNDVVHFFFSSPAPTIQAHVVVGAPSGGSADLSVAPNQKLTSPRLAAAPGGTLRVAGEIVGAASLIGQDGSGFKVAVPVVSHDGGSIVSHDGGSVIGHDGGSVISHDGGTLTYGSSSGGGGSLAGRRVTPKGPGPTQPTFTGLMKIDGNFDEYAGTLIIAIAGTNTLSQGAQQYDQLVVGGTASLFGGTLSFGLFNPDDQTNQAGVFAPPAGATFDLVVATNIVVSATYSVNGPVPGNWSLVTRPDGLRALRLVLASLPPPSLTLSPTASILQLSYPNNYTGYTVQSTPTLSPPNWTTFSTGTNLVMLSPTNSSGFFRLSKP